MSQAETRRGTVEHTRQRDMFEAVKARTLSFFEGVDLSRIDRYSQRGIDLIVAQGSVLFQGSRGNFRLKGLYATADANGIRLAEVVLPDHTQEKRYISDNFADIYIGGYFRLNGKFLHRHSEFDINPSRSEDVHAAYIEFDEGQSIDFEFTSDHHPHQQLFSSIEEGEILRSFGIKF